MSHTGQTPVFNPAAPPVADASALPPTSHKDKRPDPIASPPAPDGFSPLVKAGRISRKAGTPADRHAGLPSSVTGGFQDDTAGAVLLGKEPEDATADEATASAAPVSDHVTLAVASHLSNGHDAPPAARQAATGSTPSSGSRRSSDETQHLLGPAGQSARPSCFQRLKLLCYYPTQAFTAAAYLLLISSRLLAASSYGAAARAGADVLAQDFFGQKVDPTVQEVIFWLGTLSNAYFAYAAHSKKLVDTVKHIQDLWSEVSSARYKCDWRTTKLILVQISTAIYAALNGVSSEVSLTSLSDDIPAGVVGTAAGSYAAISDNFNAHYSAAALTEIELLTAAEDVIEGARQIAADEIKDLMSAGNSYVYSLNQAKPLMRDHINRALDNPVFAAKLEEIFGKKMDDRIKVGTEYKTLKETMAYMILSASIQALKPTRKKVGYGILSASILSQAAYYVFFLRRLLKNYYTWWAQALTYGAPALSTPSMYYAQQAAVVRAITDEKNPLAPLGVDYNPVKTNRAGQRSVHAVSSGMRIIADLTTLLALCGSVLLLFKNFWSAEDPANRWSRNILSLALGLIATYTYSVNNSQRGQRHNEELGPPLGGLVGITKETVRAFSNKEQAAYSATAPRRESPAANDAPSGIGHRLSASAPATGSDKGEAEVHARHAVSAPDVPLRPRRPSFDGITRSPEDGVPRAHPSSTGRRASTGTMPLYGFTTGRSAGPSGSGAAHEDRVRPAARRG